MKPTLVLCPLLIAIAHAERNSRAEDMPKELEMLESLIESVELEASSVVNNIHSAYSLAATAIPTALPTGIYGLLPAQTGASNAAVDGAISGQASYFTLAIAFAVVAVVCCALG
ncbi:hypothetical protein AA0119_g13265 [Alternaria tenuissima]|jgi:hypothetical protein|uniref:Uncharacterized protein n=2 Tax=Alternaria alternata complex TaxID=187734 RepID=A0A4Q4MYE0_ALTAL|nr:hypothetical protein AA0115_g12588 [Alternaria tenuissima]RYN61331.1 hypothetical protein AA0117_g12995 [Alternaria alternata]RYN28586.1 hypothetical protein AA0114_g12437 [Alternaria tenuissima]RYN85243.1 hypothetical protein AA0119_g13265 [Alternaria tenuissima]RYO00944.1 hypothetical protein AA0121_g13310 [Alternaria tenuissima]